MTVDAQLVSVTDVQVGDGFVVRLTFSDGIEGELDLQTRMWGPMFRPLLEDPHLFRQVRVDPEARTIVWPNGADIAPEALHRDVVEKRGLDQSLIGRGVPSRLAGQEFGEAHIVPSSGHGWDVVVTGATSPVSHHQTQSAAVSHARRLAASKGGGEVLIHGRQGQIRDSMTVRALGADDEALLAWFESVASREEKFRAREVSAITGVNMRQLDYLARTDLIRPSKDEEGSRGGRYYSYIALVEVKVFKSLVDAGVSTQSSRRAIEFLREHLVHAVNAPTSLVLSGDDVSVIPKEAAVEVLEGARGAITIMHLDSLWNELLQAVKDLQREARATADR